MHNLTRQAIGNIYDVGVMVGETGNQKHPEYASRKAEFRVKVQNMGLKQFDAVEKLGKKK